MGLKFHYDLQINLAEHEPPKERAEFRCIFNSAVVDGHCYAGPSIDQIRVAMQTQTVPTTTTTTGPLTVSGFAFPIL